MAIAPWAVFACSATVPELSTESSRWSIQRDEESILNTGEGTDLLFSGTPVLMFSELGPTPDPNALHPSVSRLRLSVTLATADDARAPGAVFDVDKDLLKAFAVGDVLHMARSDSGGLGLSLTRLQKLVFAIGAVSQVPLGRFVQARVPSDLTRAAEAVIRKRDATFELMHLPVEVCINGESRIWFRGRKKFGGYDVWVEHGFYPSDDSTDECVAIALVGACGAIPATASAQLLSLLPRG